MTNPTTKPSVSSSSASSSSLEALASGLKRSIAPSMRTLDGAVATARWMQKDCVDAIDKCALTTETLLKDTTALRRTKGEGDEENVDERLATVLDRVSGLSERYQTVLERTRRQKKVLENARRCDVDVVRANEGNECDFQAVLKTEAYVKR